MSVLGGLAVLALIVVAYSAVAHGLQRWSISMPIVFVVAGGLLGPNGVDFLHASINAETIKVVTELTLAVVLFADASTVNVQAFEDDAVLPGRLLVIGLPLTIGLGCLVGLALYGAEGLAFCALLAAILAPTDAALGLAIFHNPNVPVRIRRALNVESGLNDGIATPLVALFLAFTVAAEGNAPQHWLVNSLGELVGGAAIGLLVGVGGAWLLNQASARQWSSKETVQIAILALAFLAYLAALSLHTNGFIAAFVGGLAFGRTSRNRFASSVEFTDTFGTFLTILVWTVFGLTLVSATVRAGLGWRPILYAVLSLTVIRMVPVAVAMVGTRLKPVTVLVMGWFGPRGLASVVFSLLALTEFKSGGRPYEALVGAATWTILLSVVAHGLSAEPISRWYAGWLRRAGGKLKEFEDAPEPARRSRTRFRASDEGKEGGGVDSRAAGAGTV